MWLTAVNTAIAIIHGVLRLSFSYMILTAIHIYIFIVIYSVYKILEYESIHKSDPENFAYKSANIQHTPMATSHDVVAQGYSYDYNTQNTYNNENETMGYQSTIPQGP